MLEPKVDFDVLNDDGLDPVIINDRELNGEINKASTQGAKFSLLLAMLEQNHLHRPVLQEVPEPELNIADAAFLHHYRSSTLKADVESWAYINSTSQMINSGHIQDAHLWLAMHPEPLSQHNDPLHLSEEILANCSYPTQNRLQQNKEKILKVDETGLYNILQEMEVTAA
ncbi:VC2046/SO_2500 family protein [Paraglaciecola sp.]|uniref:VC2046/SO_2500 family protein n=1 Tax=Paraglaciecola sp. TaxID=1920173 RepID=UPI003EFA4D39